MAIRYRQDFQRVLEFAQEEAHQGNREYVGTEDLLLSLLRDESLLSIQILKRMGIVCETIREDLDEILSNARSDRQLTVARLPETPRAKRVIEQSPIEATLSGSEEVRNEHLLASLIHEEEGVASYVLRDHGIQLEAVRLAIAQEQGRSRLIPDWLSKNDRVVLSLANSYASEPNPSTLAILADALEEAGCQDQEILEHLRSLDSHQCPATFATGCWVVERLLNFEANQQNSSEGVDKKWWQFWK